MADGQSRTMSLVEAVANVTVGIAVQTGVNAAVLPLLGWRPDLSALLSISAVMTAVSVVRSYTMRRIFERVRGAS